MKKGKVKHKIFVVTILLVILLIPALTPESSLRCTVALFTFSPKALTSAITSESSQIILKTGQKGYTYMDPPIDKQTGGELKNWIVTRYGFVYVTEYYGYY